MSYRHSFFFSGREKADAALPIVDEQIKPLDRCINEPTDGKLTYEVKLLTEEKLTEMQAEIVVLFVQPEDYTINREDYENACLT